MTAKQRLVGFLKGTVAVFLVFVTLIAVSFVDLVAGMTLSAAVVALAVFSIKRPIQRFQLNSKVFCAFLISVGVVCLIGLSSIYSSQQEDALQALRETDVDAYLAEIKDRDEQKWLQELKELRPDLYEVEQARLAEEAAKRKAAEEAKRVAEAEERRAEIAAEREEACNDTITAFVMSQVFVEKVLKSPSTAEFPYVGDARIQTLPDCTFLVASYVDAQNSFGAMIRSDYVVKLRLLEDGESWKALDVRILN